MLRVLVLMLVLVESALELEPGEEIHSQTEEKRVEETRVERMKVEEKRSEQKRVEIAGLC